MDRKALPLHVIVVQQLLDSCPELASMKGALIRLAGQWDADGSLDVAKLKAIAEQGIQAVKDAITPSALVYAEIFKSEPGGDPEQKILWAAKVGRVDVIERNLTHFQHEAISAELMHEIDVYDATVVESASVARRAQEYFEQEYAKTGTLRRALVIAAENGKSPCAILLHRVLRDSWEQTFQLRNKWQERANRPLYGIGRTAHECIIEGIVNHHWHENNLLYSCIQGGAFDYCQYLLQSSDIGIEYFNEAFVSACERGASLEIIKALSNGREIPVYSSGLALKCACAHGRTDIIRHVLGLLPKSPLPSRMVDEFFIKASGKGRADVVELLLQHRFDTSKSPLLQRLQGLDKTEVIFECLMEPVVELAGNKSTEDSRALLVVLNQAASLGLRDVVNAGLKKIDIKSGNIIHGDVLALFSEATKHGNEDIAIDIWESGKVDKDRVIREFGAEIVERGLFGLADKFTQRSWNPALAPGYSGMHNTTDRGQVFRYLVERIDDGMSVSAARLLVGYAMFLGKPEELEALLSKIDSAKPLNNNLSAKQLLHQAAWGGRHDKIPTILRYATRQSEARDKICDEVLYAIFGESTSRRKETWPNLKTVQALLDEVKRPITMRIGIAYACNQNNSALLKLMLPASGLSHDDIVQYAKICADNKFLEGRGILEQFIDTGRVPPVEHDIAKQEGMTQEIEKIKNILTKEGCASIVVNDYAKQSCAIFETEQRSLKYLKKCWEVGDIPVAGKQPLHDALQFTLPSREYAQKAWADFAIANGRAAARFLENADKLGAPTSLRELKEKEALIVYENAAENAELATLCHSLGVNEDAFKTALKTVSRASKNSELPDVTIKTGGYTFKRLPPGDIRGLFLGKFTSCCQSIGEAGEDCAIHGFTNPRSGFYIVLDQKGEIIGQAWASMQSKQEILLDSLESKLEKISAKDWASFIEELAKETGCSIAVGAGGATPALPYPNRQKAARHPDYDAENYHDSRQQYLYKCPPEYKKAKPLKKGTAANLDIEGMHAKLAALQTTQKISVQGNVAIQPA